MMVKRSWLRTGVVMVSVAMLASGLVVATPDSAGPRIEVRPVQLTSMTLSPSVYLGALQKFIASRVPAPAPVAPAAKPGGADVPSLDVTAPTMTALNAEPAALAAPVAGLSILDPILGIVSPILGLLTNPAALLLFAPIILLVIVACPPCALFNFVTGILGSFAIGLAPVPLVAAAATLEAGSTVEPTLDAESSLKDASPIDARGAETKSENTKADNASRRQNEELTTERATSTDGVTETATTEQDSTEPKEADASDSTNTDAKRGPEEPRKQQATSRPVVRDSQAADEQRSDPPRRGKGDHENKSPVSDAAPKAGDSSDAQPHGSSSENKAGASN